MVHKSQESLAREVLSAYPWFAGRTQEIKAVREENLEYDPTNDGAKSELNWDTRSIASTDMLGGYGGGKSELGTPYGGTPGDEYKQYPLPSVGGEYGHYPLPNNDSSIFNLPLDNPSTDHLVQQQQPYGRSEQYTPRRQASRPYPGGAQMGDSISAAPLLDHIQPTPLSPNHGHGHGGHGSGGSGSNIPYPPSAFTSPPAGYTPPTMRRMDTSTSVGSDASWDRGDLGNSSASAAPSYYSQPGAGGPYQGYGGNIGRGGSPAGNRGGYPDPYGGR